MTKVIGKDNIALVKGRQSALMKAVKKVKKGKAIGAKEPKVSSRGIIMLNHIPHGFYEDEMRSYFSQFGKVLRVRVARSKKTGKSRGYAYVEFEFEEVAKIAAEAMNNYLMFERLIKCELLPPTVIPRKIFRDKYITEEKFPKLGARKKRFAVEDVELTEEESKDILQQRLKKLKERSQKLAEMGINYQFNLKVNESSGFNQNELGDKDEIKDEDEMEIDEDNSSDSPSDDQDQDDRDISDDPFDLSEDEIPVKSPTGKGLSPKIGKVKTPEAKTPKFSPKLGKANTPQNKLSIFSPKIGKAKTPEAKTPKFSPTVGKTKTPENKLSIFSPKIGKAKTPENKTPKLYSIIEKAKTPENKLSNSSPKIEKAKTPEAKTPKLSSIVEKAKTPENKMPKYSPKMLRSRKSQGPAASTPTSSVKQAAKNTPAKGKISDLPRISPKMLRSKKSEAATTSVSKSKSPELLKNKQSGNTKEDVKKTPAKGKGKIQDLPKISPKLLRSRKSDASALTPMKEKASTPSKAKKAGRKSVF